MLGLRNIYLFLDIAPEIKTQIMSLLLLPVCHERKKTYYSPSNEFYIKFNFKNLILSYLKF